MSTHPKPVPMKRRFRGFLPVVVDVETGGFNAQTDALLEIASIVIEMDDRGHVYPGKTIAFHVKPFEGAILEQRALDFNKIDPYHPFRFAVAEKDALEKTFSEVGSSLESFGCTRAILVGHNPFFDLGFLKAATERCRLKNSPFHAFSTFDTATLGGVAYGQTVLARAVQAAKLDWDESEAHSAIYDAERTASLFCTIVNNWWHR